MEKSIFIFDQNKCVGCHACMVACMNENGFQFSNQWRTIHHSNEYHLPQLPLFYLSLACNHCDDAPCLKNCPALAYSRDENTGAVIHDPEKCIGCKYCTWACPYDAPKFNSQKGIIEKCTFCNHRIENNLNPACANACPTGALDFSIQEFTREESNESSPVPVKVGSKIKITAARKETAPEIDLNLFKNQPDNFKNEIKAQKINAKKEWPLLVFTLITTTLVSLFISGKTESFNIYSKLVYLSFAFIAFIFSTLHLGKKIKSWRSLINIKNSWLSKEILAFTLFGVSIFLDFFLINIPFVLIVFFGITLLISIDMIYMLATWKWPLKIHSAQTFLIGLTLFSLLSQNIYLLIFLIGFRATIYIKRKIIYKKNEWAISIFRILLLINTSILILFEQTTLALLLFAIGEIIDRIEFYNELNVPYPKTELDNKKAS